LLFFIITKKMMAGDNSMSGGIEKGKKLCRAACAPMLPAPDKSVAGFYM
jgi:hypothetical protein